MLQGLGLSDSREGVVENGLDERERPRGDLSVILDPEAEGLPELGVEDGGAPAIAFPAWTETVTYLQLIVLLCAS
jgi:hypothetical protein